MIGVAPARPAVPVLARPVTTQICGPVQAGGLPPAVVSPVVVSPTVVRRVARPGIHPPVAAWAGALPRPAVPVAGLLVARRPVALVPTRMRVRVRAGGPLPAQPAFPAVAFPAARMSMPLPVAAWAGALLRPGVLVATPPAIPVTTRARAGVRKAGRTSRRGSAVVRPTARTTSPCPDGPRTARPRRASPTAAGPTAVGTGAGDGSSAGARDPRPGPPGGPCHPPVRLTTTRRCHRCPRYRPGRHGGAGGRTGTRTARTRIPTAPPRAAIRVTDGTRPPAASRARQPMTSGTARAATSGTSRTGDDDY
jgi:hypothetical protein